MRVGFNPNKDKKELIDDYYHQVVIPVHIPNLQEYFKDSLEILEYCIQSLKKTCHPQTFISVVDNGCCTEVRDYLDNLRRNNEIHELIHTAPIGKLNAVLKGIMGHSFPIVTVTDADVLFKNDWQKSCYNVFETFPRAGAICTTPSSKVLRRNNAGLIVGKLFSGKLKFTEIPDPEARIHFAKSIDNPDVNNEHHLKYNLTIEKDSLRAVVGASHFVATYRGDIFDTPVMRYSEFRLGGTSESEILDQPVDKQGYWRLGTEQNFTYHMGNTSENWMVESVENLKNQSTKNIARPRLSEVNRSGMINGFRRFIFKNIIIREPLWRWVLRYKGLSKRAAKNY